MTMLAAPPKQTRREQIIAAIDAFKKVHDAWEADRNAPPQPSELFERALNLCVRLCQYGDIPSDCRSIVAAVARMGLAWIKYQQGNMKSDGTPFQSFWDTVRGVFIARAGANIVPMRRPESVRALRKQNVPDPQIATQIYGDPEWPNGKGPFLTERGAVDEAALDAEERANAEGRSTLPDDWVQYIDRDRFRREEQDLADQLAMLTNAVYVAPPRVEDMDGLIREGQYVDVIARECRASVDDVVARCGQLGVEPQHRPNLQAERAPQEPDINPHAAAAMDATIHAGVELPAGQDFAPDLEGPAGPSIEQPDSSLDIMQQVEQMASRGFQPEQILQQIGMTPDELSKHSGRSPKQIQKALRGGK